MASLKKQLQKAGVRYRQVTSKPANWKSMLSTKAEFEKAHSKKKEVAKKMR